MLKAQPLGPADLMGGGKVVWCGGVDAAWSSRAEAVWKTGENFGCSQAEGRIKRVEEAEGAKWGAGGEVVVPWVALGLRRTPLPQS